MLNSRFSVTLVAASIIALSGLTGCGDDEVCSPEAVNAVDDVYKCVCKEGDDVTSQGIFYANDPKSVQNVSPECYVKPSGNPPSPDGATHCTVTQVTGGALIECTDGTEAFVSDGSDGSAGVDGTSCTVREVTGGVLIECPDGSSAFIPTGGGGPNPPPPATGWMLCEMAFPSPASINDLNWYQSMAHQYRNNSSGLKCYAPSYTELFGVDPQTGYPYAETYVAVNHDPACWGTLNALAQEILGAAVSAIDSAQFHQLDGVTAGYDGDPGGCALAFLAVFDLNFFLSGQQPMSGSMGGNQDEADNKINRGTISLEVLESLRLQNQALLLNKDVIRLGGPNAGLMIIPEFEEVTDGHIKLDPSL